MRRRESGAVLIFTLLALAGLVAIVAGAAAVQRLAYKAEVNRIEQRRAKLMAEAGIQRALASLSSQDPSKATQQDDWYTLGTQAADQFTVDGDSYRLQNLDAGSLVNLNAANEQQLLKLPLTQEQVDCLLDWRSPGTQARPDGAKDDYYNGLTNPYNAKLASLDTFDELLLIKNFTPATLYEPQDQNGTTVVNTSSTTGNGYDQTLYAMSTVDSVSPNTTPAGQPKANINTATVQALQRARITPTLATQIVALRNRSTFTNIGQALSVPGMTNTQAQIILDAFTTSTARTQTGKLNLNTVSQAILNTIPAIQPDMASAIISRQGTGFNSLGDLTTIPGFTVPVLAQVADMFTVGSSAFIVRVEGTAGSTRVPLEAIVTVQNGSARVTKEWSPPYADMVPRWGWDTSTSNQIDLSGNG